MYREILYNITELVKDRLKHLYTTSHRLLVGDHVQSCLDTTIVESISWRIVAARAIDKKLSFSQAGAI